MSRDDDLNELTVIAADLNQINADASALIRRRTEIWKRLLYSEEMTRTERARLREEIHIRSGVTLTRISQAAPESYVEVSVSVDAGD